MNSVPYYIYGSSFNSTNSTTSQNQQSEPLDLFQYPYMSSFTSSVSGSGDSQTPRNKDTMQLPIGFLNHGHDSSAVTDSSANANPLPSQPQSQFQLPTQNQIQSQSGMDSFDQEYMYLQAQALQSSSHSQSQSQYQCQYQNYQMTPQPAYNQYQIQQSDPYSVLEPAAEPEPTTTTASMPSYSFSQVESPLTYHPVSLVAPHTTYQREIAEATASRMGGNSSDETETVRSTSSNSPGGHPRHRQNGSYPYQNADASGVSLGQVGDSDVSSTFFQPNVTSHSTPSYMVQNQVQYKNHDPNQSHSHLYSFSQSQINYSPLQQNEPTLSSPASSPTRVKKPRNRRKMIRDEDKPYKCDYEGCGLSYTKKDRLKKHIENKHASVTPEFVCLVCSKKYGSDDDLKRHRNTHTDRYKCHFCGIYRGDRKDRFEKHKEKCAKKFQCP
ncbi:unnamed protein product [Ambrosiozyma monospora]|uniref:Unnamed protein product n=1 Tax=Ambrosiozyma monospora TaxID=43982 RepID=A0A9W6YWY1_AMBMO|nr:unnamed protein product [Ambrosiozyma monospora]